MKKSTRDTIKKNMKDYVVKKYVKYAVAEDLYEKVKEKIDLLPTFNIDSEREIRGHIEFEVSGDSSYDKEWKKLDDFIRDINYHNRVYERGNSTYSTLHVDSYEDWGWISTPELLEEDDFYDNATFEDWKQALKDLTDTRIKMVHRIDYAETMLDYLQDIMNDNVREEIKNDLLRFIKANKGVKDSKKKNKHLKDGTFNFASMGVFPVYGFQIYEDIIDKAEYDNEYPKKKDFENEDDYDAAIDTFIENYLDEISKDWDILYLEEYENLKDDLDNLNWELKIEAYQIEDYDDPSDEDLYLAAAIRDIADFKIKEGYYEGFEIYSKYADRADKDLPSEWIDKIESKLNEIAKKYHLTEMVGGGWGGYHRIKDSYIVKAKSCKDGINKVKNTKLTDEKEYYVIEECNNRSFIFKGTISYLSTKSFSYTLECGNRWNPSIPRNPKTIKSLVNALNTSESECNNYNHYYKVGTEEDWNNAKEMGIRHVRKLK